VNLDLDLKQYLGTAQGAITMFGSPNTSREKKGLRAKKWRVSDWGGHWR
jgi:hypothetical protein